MLNESLELSLMVGVPAFIAGYLLAKLVTFSSDRVKEDNQDPRDRRIRALEADLRLAERKLQDKSSETGDQRTQLDDAATQVEKLQASLQQADAENAKLKEELRISCAKTVELRQELTDRAEQTIRGQVELDEMKTELQVTKAGTDAVLDEINRLNQEREELSDTVRGLKKLVREE